MKYDEMQNLIDKLIDAKDSFKDDEECCLLLEAIDDLIKLSIIGWNNATI